MRQHLAALVVVPPFIALRLISLTVVELGELIDDVDRALTRVEAAISS